ncbi:hypothetical protein BDV95DRAFT_157671 [Massariosphaeria phaeospora]|uniref:Uncharacterized protein n=1 Tax=Massariosphaeria phaeospora TaxID=100035 RepID=A0A7C8M3Y3_9PLEO|nr:hypothetical protein BDV95DRAFT_157671 [Massariosphaeria phaeospora]
MKMGISVALPSMLSVSPLQPSWAIPSRTSKEVLCEADIDVLFDEVPALRDGGLHFDEFVVCMVRNGVLAGWDLSPTLTQVLNREFGARD